MRPNLNLNTYNNTGRKLYGHVVRIYEFNKSIMICCNVPAHSKSVYSGEGGVG